MTAPEDDQRPMATVLIAIVDERDTGRQILFDIGRVPIPPDRPPLTTDLLAVMRTTIERVSMGMHTRAEFEKITDQLTDLDTE